MMSTESSVDPPSIMMYSRFGYPCDKTDAIVCSRNFPWLKEGVTMLIFGGDLRDMVLPNVPIDRAAQPLFKIGSGAEAEKFLGLVNVESAAWLAVGLG